MRRLLHRFVVFVALAGLVAMVPVEAGAEPRSPAAAEAEFVRLANEERASRGHETLRRAGDLDDVARIHSADMADARRLWHSDTDGIPNWSRVAENVGKGPSVERLHDAFVESDSHRRNLLGPYTEIGVGVVITGDVLWVTIVVRVPDTEPAPEPEPEQEPVPATTGGGASVSPATPVEPAAAPRTVTTAGATTSSGSGWWRLERDGSVHRSGDAPHHGELADARSDSEASGADALDLAVTPSESGYRILTASGRVEVFGDATDFGDSAGSGIEPVALAARPDGAGYWIAGGDGAVRAFGAALTHGAADGHRENRAGISPVDVVDIAATPTGQGFWLLDESGGVFAFGDASFHGSVPALRAEGYEVPTTPFVAMTGTARGGGYWLLDESGGVLAFGAAFFHGSAPIGSSPSRALEVMPADGGSLVLFSDGGVVGLGEARYRWSAR